MDCAIRARARFSLLVARDPHQHSCQALERHYCRSTGKLYRQSLPLSFYKMEASTVECGFAGCFDAGTVSAILSGPVRQCQQYEKQKPDSADTVTLTKNGLPL